MRRRQMICECTAFLIAILMLAGTCYAAESSGDAAGQEAGKSADTADAFANQILELGKEYGYMATGTAEFQVKNGDRSVNFLWPEDISAHRDGILFTDVHDYDGDDQDELLVLRRQRGMVNVKTGDWVYAQERSDYIFEMYEYSEKKKESALSGRFIAGVFDEFNLFMARNGAGIFRRDNDGKSEIIVETFKEEQDHPHVICLMRLGYNGKNFNNASGFRYGALFWGDQNVQFQQFKTMEAYGLLSSNSSMDDAVEVIAAADKEADEAVSSALEKGLADLGLARLDAKDDKADDSKEEADKSDDSKADADKAEDNKTDLDALMEHSGLGGYKAAEGTLTPLGYIGCQLNSSKKADEGYTSVKMERISYTTDPDGADRPKLETAE